MATIHRLQWIDAEIRAGRHPNTKNLAERFEISRRQALRDFEYLRDSLGAPLEYSAKFHGYCYTSDAYILPGPFVTGEERRLLNDLQSYYSRAAQDDAPGSGAYAQVANLMQKLGGITRQAPQSSETKPERPAWEMPSPYRASIALPDDLPPRSLSILEPYLVSRQQGAIACEFRDWEQFLDLLLGMREPVSVQWPTWLRERLVERLNAWLVRQPAPTQPNHDDDESLMQRTALPRHEELGLAAPRSAVPASTAGSRSQLPPEGPTRRHVEASMVRSNNSYLGALYGVLQTAGMCDLSFDLFAAQTGRAFQLSVHCACHPSSVSVYNWTGDHRRAVDLIGVFTQVITFEPHYITYPAACKRVIASIKQGLNRGFGAVLWGVDGGEFGVIKGYNDDDGVFLVDGVSKWTSGESAPILYDNVGRTFNVPILHCQIPIERVDYNEPICQKVVLSQYVQGMESPTLYNADYYYGLAAYPVWDAALRAKSFDQTGVRYIAGYYAEARRQMAAYVRHVAPTLSLSSGVVALYEQLAAIHAKMVTDILVQDESIWNTQGWRPLTSAQADALASLVREAGRLESQGVNAIKQLLRQDESRTGYAPYV